MVVCSCFASTRLENRIQLQLDSPKVKHSSYTARVLQRLKRQGFLAVFGLLIDDVMGSRNLTILEVSVL